MRMVAKSGCPVRGQRQVNSGHSKEISYSRPGSGLGKLSSVRVGRDVTASIGQGLPRFSLHRGRGWRRRPGQRIDEEQAGAFPGIARRLPVVAGTLLVEESMPDTRVDQDRRILARVLEGRLVGPNLLERDAAVLVA